MRVLHDNVRRKFTGVCDANEWLIETDTGYQPLIDVKQTVEYEVWELTLTNGYSIKCADNHIVFYNDYREVYVKDLVVGDFIITDSGLVDVESVINLGYSEQMYDLGVDSTDHRYYSDRILSHNTTCASAYLLWYAMFNADQTILVAAHKFTGAQEIMQRIRFGYESCPDYIRAGITSYNKGSIEFDNGSRIVSQTTTATTGRGMSISLLYCLGGDTYVTIRNKQTLIEEDITLQELYLRLNPDINIITE
jgi:hypothetical protein